ncbi:hypothetical protein TorRG33x02_023700 [Trema orientale]|uniref:Uncharacterized protein n=1 Tax=Trema orientale TaxID=63057 RepID=A0A2P5FUX6_TREOI|nr:hypothetical protein TorRG33x02_023700 [Trema orientale]
MEESGSKKDDVQVRRLSIIDFSSEDDSLLGLPSGFPQENQELRSIELFESVRDDKLVDFDGVTGQKELVPQPSECLEPERVRRNGKYNLRKSLAWDSAFFTCEGVLDAEELSSMTGVDKGEKQLLPGIEEEVHRSTDSISTLESDTLTLESNETNLFEDIRASIQKSSKAAVTADESGKVGSGVRETKTGNALRRVELASQPKMKPKVASKKPSIGMQNPGTLARQVSASPQFSQSSAVSGESTLSLMKRPKVQGKPIPSSTTLAKRASLGGNLLKMEKDKVKTAGRGAPVSKLPGSSRNVPRPTVSFKSSSVASSTATTTEATSSSFDSSTSTTSVKIGKSPSNSMRGKADTRTGNPRSSGSNPKTPSRISSVNKTGPGKSHISSQLMPFSKLSSSISPASSISDWSSESVSSISSLQQISCSSRDSIQSSCKRVSIDFDTPQSLDSENHVDDRSSIGRVTLPSASKPSGLRLPSPKIGFFDGVKSAVRTPKRSVQSHPIAPSNLPKIGAGGGSKTRGQIKAKLGKLNPERAVTNSTKPDAQRTSSNTKPKVSTSQEASKAATRISSALRKVESCHATSPEVKNDTPLKNGSENYLKAEEVGSGGDDIGLHDKDTGLAENNETVDVPKAEMTPENKCSAHKEDLKISPITGGHTAISDLSSISNLTNLTLPQEVTEHTKKEELSFMNDLHSSKKSNEKERSHFEDQIDCLTRQTKAMDIKGTQEMVLSDSFSSQQNLNGEDNVCAPKSSSHRELLVCVQEDSLINLSKPTLFPTTNENAAGKRIPFSVKDSLCNIGESFDVSKGLTVSEGEKNSQLPSSEEQLAEIV